MEVLWNSNGFHAHGYQGFPVRALAHRLQVGFLAVTDQLRFLTRCFHASFCFLDRNFFLDHNFYPLHPSYREIRVTRRC